MTAELLCPERQESKRKAVRSVRFFAMFAALCALFAMGQFHRSSGGVLSTVFDAEFALSAGQLGFVIGAMFIAQGLFQLPAGVLVDRFGTRRVVPASSLVAVAGCLLIASADSALGVATGRILLGAGFAASMMGSYVVFVNWSPSREVATLTGRFLFIGGFGGLLGTLPLAALIEVIGWRNVFLVLAGCTLLAAAVAFLAVRDHPSASKPEDDSHRPGSLKDSLTGLISVLKSPRIRPILVIAIFLYSPLQILIGLWAGPFLKDVHGLDSVERSYILLTMAIGMNLGMLFYGPLERRLDRRRSLVVVSALVVAALFGMLAAFAYAYLTLAVLVLVALTLVAPFFVVVLAHAQRLFEPVLAGRVVSSINVLAITGIFVMQNVTGQIIGAVPHQPEATGSVLGYRLVFALMAVVFVFVAVMYSRSEEIVAD